MSDTMHYFRNLVENPVRITVPYPSKSSPTEITLEPRGRLDVIAVETAVSRHPRFSRSIGKLIEAIDEETYEERLTLGASDPSPIKQVVDVSDIEGETLLWFDPKTGEETQMPVVVDEKPDRDKKRPYKVVKKGETFGGGQRQIDASRFPGAEFAVQTGTGKKD